jgi:hypothetical protein
MHHYPAFPTHFHTSFFIALDLSTLHSMLYLDVCTHFTLMTTIHNYHQLVMLLFDCHTGAYMYEVFGKFMDAIIPEGRKFLIEVSTDRAWSIIGKIQGMVKLI